MRSPPCSVPNADPNPDASPLPAPMTPRAPPPRHHSPHLLLAEAVATWHPFQKKPCPSDRSTAPPPTFLTRRHRRPPRRGAAAADPSVGLVSASAGDAAPARGRYPAAAATVGDPGRARISISRAELEAEAPLTRAGRCGRRMWGRFG
jgi:hypothetical protein